MLSEFGRLSLLTLALSSLFTLTWKSESEHGKKEGAAYLPLKLQCHVGGQVVEMRLQVGRDSGFTGPCNYGGGSET